MDDSNISDINKEEKPVKNSNIRLAAIIFVLIVLIIVTVGLVYWFKKQNPGTDPVVVNIDNSIDLSADFTNEELILAPATEMPAEIVTRFQDQLKAYEEEIVYQEETGEDTPYQGYLGVANTYRQLGEYQKAEDAYKIAIEKFPDDELTWHNLGVLYEDMHQYLKAAEAYATSIEKKPIQYISHVKLAEIYRKHSSSPEKANDIYLQALIKTNNDINIIKAYADYLERYAKNYQEAIIYWQEVLKQQPDNAAVQTKIDYLNNKLETN